MSYCLVLVVPRDRPSAHSDGKVRVPHTTQVECYCWDTILTNAVDEYWNSNATL